MKAIDNKTDNTGNIVIDLGGGLDEPVDERKHRMDNLSPEKKAIVERLQTTGEIIPSDFTHSVKFYDTPKEDPPTEVLKPKPVVKVNKPIEADSTGSDNRNDKNRYGNYIIMT
jgi:hypothetical protein